MPKAYSIDTNLILGEEIKEEEEERSYGHKRVK